MRYALGTRRDRQEADRFLASMQLESMPAIERWLQKSLRSHEIKPEEREMVQEAALLAYSPIHPLADLQSRLTAQKKKAN